MKMIKISLILIVFTLIISGCTPKVITKIEYIKEEPYEFQKVDLSGAYIDINENEKICIPKLKELNTIYKETKSFYDNQIDEYLNKGNNK